MKKGIDISKWQGKIDFAKVKADGIEFVIARSSYRQTVDPKFHEYMRGCKANDLPVLGVYHFIYALNEEQTLAEAKFCVEQVKKAGLGKEIYIFSDFEGDSVVKAAEKGVVLGKEDCNKFTEIFCEYVKSQGYNTGIYLNNDYYKNWYKQELLDKYDIWLADYTGEANYKCLFHQYTNSGKVAGINGKVDMDYYYGEEKKEEKVEEVKPMSTSRQAVVDLIQSWLGKNEADGSFKSIIDIYNSYDGAFPRGTKMKYDWSWCACTWSAIAIKLGYTNIMPIEISCGELIKAAQKMGCWKENDGYVGQPGDGILYDWDDKGSGDNTGWPDHIGVITETHEDAGYFVVTEGNYDNSVKKRTVSINGKFIRGFITPAYDNNSVKEPVLNAGKSIKTIAREVIAGTWGTGVKRKKALEAAGYNYTEVQKMVNELLTGSAEKPAATVKPTETITKKVTATCSAKKFSSSVAGEYKNTSNLYLRNDAGGNKKSLCVIPKGTEVKCFGYYSLYQNVKWLYIQFVLDGVQYTGFSSSKYLKKK